MWLASRLGYYHGPCGVAPVRAGEYIVRPVINTYGMGAGASFMHLTPNDHNTVPPGYFWCERFYGEQLSYELTWKSMQWRITSVWLAERTSEVIPLFDRWIRVERPLTLPAMFDTLWDCGSINVETVGGKIVEVHLRSTPDPTEWSELIPVWDHTPVETIRQLTTTHTFVESPDFVYGTEIVRTGFFCK